MNQPKVAIHDLGYRRYDGERGGQKQAILALITHSIRRAFGLKRSARHKIAPVLAIAMAFVPAVVYLVITAFIGTEIASEFTSYEQYGSSTLTASFLLAAAVVPGVLTSDRTSGMLSIYLASPLNRTTYVFAKAAGLLVVMLTVTLMPIMFLVIADVIGGVLTGFSNIVEMFARAIAAGLLAGLFYVGMSMLIASFPKRWGVASVAIIAVMIVPSVVTNILLFETDAPSYIAFFSPGDLVGEGWSRIFGFRSPVRGLPNYSDSLVLGAAVAVTAIAVIGTWVRYQLIKVER